MDWRYYSVVCKSINRDGYLEGFFRFILIFNSLILNMFVLRRLKPAQMKASPISHSLKAGTFLRGFALLTESQQNDMSQQMFLVGEQNGFLPRQDPLAELPSEFIKLESLLQRMPLQLPDGSPGLLASGQFGEAVRDELPIYDVDHINDQRLLSGKRSHFRV